MEKQTGRVEWNVTVQERLCDVVLEDDKLESDLFIDLLSSLKETSRTSTVLPSSNSTFGMFMDSILSLMVQSNNNNK